MSSWAAFGTCVFQVSLMHFGMGPGGDGGKPDRPTAERTSASQPVCVLKSSRIDVRRASLQLTRETRSVVHKTYTCYESFLIRFCALERLGFVVLRTAFASE